MFKKLSFQRNILLIYTLFIVVLLSILGIVFFQYNMYIYQKNAESMMSQTASIISRQLDNIVIEMDSIAESITKDINVIDEMSAIQRQESSIVSGDNLFLSSKILQDGLEAKTAALSDIYRSSLFNLFGDIVSTKKIEDSKGVLLDKVGKLNWVDEVIRFRSQKHILEPYYDPWANESHIQVFSLVRAFQYGGKVVGFVEIQQRADQLDKICDVKINDKFMIAVINEKGKVIYSNWKLFSKVLINHYMDLAGGDGKQTVTAQNPFSKLPETISYQRSDSTGWTIFIIQNQKALFAPLMSVRNITIVVIVGIILVSILVFSIFARRLTTPLKCLKDEMEKISMENLPDNINVGLDKGMTNNEIAALSHSFQQMRTRLNQAMEMEIKSRSLQLKAHFEALQSQINPHFLFNVLGIIPSFADEEQILDTCLKLSDMLRYSTSNINARVTLMDEITHASNYLTLMKKRFEHRLEYAIHIDEHIKQVVIPKLIIQPLVENSLSHGFDAAPRPVMKITIDAFVKDDEWCIRIRDNGSGFGDEVPEKLKLRIEKYTENLLSSERTEELGIGGMGLVNTFARLLLFYGKRFRFDISNNPAGGALISMSGSLAAYELEGESGNV